MDSKDYPGEVITGQRLFQMIQGWIDARQGVGNTLVPIVLERGEIFSLFKRGTLPPNPLYRNPLLVRNKRNNAIPYLVRSFHVSMNGR